MTEQEDIRRQVIAVVENTYGQVEEKLIASGIVDSLRAVQLAITLEKQFQLEPDSFSLRDMQTLTSLTARVVAARKKVLG